MPIKCLVFLLLAAPLFAADPVPLLDVDFVAAARGRVPNRAPGGADNPGRTGMTRVFLLCLALAACAAARAADTEAPEEAAPAAPAVETAAVEAEAPPAAH